MVLAAVRLKELSKYIFGMASKYILLSRANNKMTRKFELGERDTFIYKLRHE
jgi:hypothetical protein